ncbi:hypothetical protein [Streptomyces sp. enrichment culture]|uniref:hypothetical protein n=1 Tax=Streptomyces sp. enrichment culture TaxID=1795815 RepID=UPI003F56C08E
MAVPSRAATDESGVYPASVAALNETFQAQLAHEHSRGMMVLDSRTKVKNAPNVHCDDAYQPLREQFGERLKNLQFRYQDPVGKWRGGIVVSDRRTRQSSGLMFGPAKVAAAVRASVVPGQPGVPAPERPQPEPDGGLPLVP